MRLLRPQVSVQATHEEGNKRGGHLEAGGGQGGVTTLLLLSWQDINRASLDSLKRRPQQNEPGILGTIYVTSAVSVTSCRGPQQTELGILGTIYVTSPDSVTS